MGDQAESRAQKLSLAAILLAGAALRLWQYFGNASLWIDEIALVENVLGRSIGSLLTRPLAFDQVAPPGSLATLKAATAVLGSSELALRLVPLLCGLASLPLFALLAFEFLGGWEAIFATGLFAASSPLIFYAAEVKQYSSDVLSAILLWLTALWLAREPTPKTSWRAGAIGAALVWFSQPSVLLLAGLGAALVSNALSSRGRKGLRPLVPALALWAASAAAALAWNERLVTAETRSYLAWFWSHGFPRLPPTNKAELFWLPRVLLNVWRDRDFPGPLVYFALVLAGAVALWRTRREVALLLIAPMGVALAAAAARQYPFAGRVTLFLAPAFFLLAAAGARLTADRLARVRVPPAATVLLLAVPPAVALAHHHPVRRLEEARPIAERLAASLRAGDATYVYYGAKLAYAHYGRRLGIDTSGATLGGCHRDDPRAYLREVDALRGRSRVWLFVSHTLPELREELPIRAYLDQIGMRRETLVAPGVVLDLYDLSDAARLATAAAETFPVPKPANPDLFRCDHGPHAAIDERESPPQDARNAAMKR